MYHIISASLPCFLKDVKKKEQIIKMFGNYIIGLKI